jgi:ABC-2 type transport system permease protein
MDAGRRWKGIPMNALIATEWLKLRTTRAAYVAAGFVVLIAVAVPLVGALLAGTGDIAPLRAADLPDVLRGPVALAGGAVLLVGLLSGAGEFRHHTVLTTRLAEPRPGRILVAKLMTMAYVGFLTGAAMIATMLIEAAVMFPWKDVAFEPLTADVVQVAVAVPFIIALHGLFGVAIGSLLRNTAAAVGATLVWAFVVEGIVPMVTRSPGIVHWLPTGLVREALQAHTPAGQLAPIAAGAVLLGYAVALVGTTAVLDRRRQI